MKSLIFDVDGTLWDSTPQIAECWKSICSSREIPCKHIDADRLKQEFGKLLNDIGRSLFPELPEKNMHELIQECCEKDNEWLIEHPAVVYTGVKEVFRSLHERGIPIVIVSNCEAGYIEVMMKTNQLEEYVLDHLCPGDTGLAKADNIKLAIERNNLDDPVYVGDTIGDYQATKIAGIPFVFAAYGFGSVPEPDYLINSPSDLCSFPEITSFQAEH